MAKYTPHRFFFVTKIWSVFDHLPTYSSKTLLLYSRETIFKNSTLQLFVVLLGDIKLMLAGKSVTIFSRAATWTWLFYLSVLITLLIVKYVVIGLAFFSGSLAHYAVNVKYLVPKKLSLSKVSSVPYFVLIVNLSVRQKASC